MFMDDEKPMDEKPMGDDSAPAPATGAGTGDDSDETPV